MKESSRKQSFRFVLPFEVILQIRSQTGDQCWQIGAPCVREDPLAWVRDLVHRTPILTETIWLRLPLLQILYSLSQALRLAASLYIYLFLSSDIQDRQFGFTSSRRGWAVGERSNPVLALHGVESDHKQKPRPIGLLRESVEHVLEFNNPTKIKTATSTSIQI